MNTTTTSTTSTTSTTTTTNDDETNTRVIVIMRIIQTLLMYRVATDLGTSFHPMIYHHTIKNHTLGHTVFETNPYVRNGEQICCVGNLHYHHGHHVFWVDWVLRDPTPLMKIWTAVGISETPKDGQRWDPPFPFQLQIPIRTSRSMTSQNRVSNHLKKPWSWGPILSPGMCFQRFKRLPLCFGAHLGSCAEALRPVTRALPWRRRPWWFLAHKAMTWDEMGGSWWFVTDWENMRHETKTLDVWKERGRRKGLLSHCHFLRSDWTCGITWEVWQQGV